MTVEREDLGLSLSLSFHDENKRIINVSNNNNPTSFHHQLNLMMMPNSSSNIDHHQCSSFGTINQSSNRSQAAFPSSGFETCRVETRSFLKGIDVNCLPPPASNAEEEEGGVSSPNSTVSSVSGKRSEREANDVEHEMDRACSDRGISDDEDAENARKKLRLSKDQSAVLEESFKDHNTLNPKQKLALAKRLGLRPRQVEVWFQNRRARTKLKQTEVDCEFLKRCCENLTDENRRLQKEVQELRALKLSPQLYMQMTPPTTLTMCPSCERVGPPTSGSIPTQMVPAQPRQLAFNPWAAAASIQQRPFDGLRSRS